MPLRSVVLVLAAGLALLAGLMVYSSVGQRTPDPPVTTIAFGSCNKQWMEQPIWGPVQRHTPDLWIWLGDNIYADTQDMAEMERDYAQQRAHPGYQSLRASTRVLGIWDDHDYGVNDGGRFYPKRDSSQQLFLDFLDVPDDDPRRLRRGVYSAHTFGPAGRRVKVILLDTRYHRDTLQAINTKAARYAPNPEGDILGDAQWTWLEDELRSSDAQIHLVGTSIQALPTEHRWEKWSNFPAARQRLFDVLRRSEAPGIVLLSGDRHKSELSRLDDALPYPLYELTASGMTHTAPRGPEANALRLGSLIYGKNFGLLSINWDAAPVTLRLQIRDVDDTPVIDRTLALDQLQP